MTDILPKSSHRAAAWLSAGLAAAVLMCPADAAPIMMRPGPGASYEQGIYYLIPQPYEAVKTSLEQDLASPGLSGFQWRNDSAALSRMEFYWARVSATHNPALRESLSQQASQAAAPVLERALRAGVITRTEHADFARAIAAQPGHADKTIGQAPFFAQTIPRWSFYREQAKSRPAQKDYGTVMDVSPMAGRSPMTLVWFGGTSTTVSRQFNLFSCMVGVTCVPNPHIERKTESASRTDPALERAVAEFAQRMQALPPSDADRIMQGYFDAYGYGVSPAAVPVVRSASLPETSLPGAELPADESMLRRYGNHDWSLLALPDGSLLASGSASHLYLPQGDAVERRDAAPGFGQAFKLKIAADGLVWGSSMGNDGAHALVAWRPGQGKPHSYAPPQDLRYWPADGWSPRPAGGVAVRAGDSLFVLSPQGEWSQRAWNSALRGEVDDALEQAMPRARSNRIHFGDSLFWSAGRGAYGIDPGSARVARSFKAATGNLFFGSLPGNWALAAITGNGGRRFRVIDLATGLPRFDVDTPTVHNTSSLARSARGRLLAVSGSDNAVTVLDMAEEKPVLNLRLPKNESVSAMAFSWKGDKLWIYARKVGAADGARLIAWNVPDGLADGAAAADFPDQLRCGYSMDCR